MRARQSARQSTSPWASPFVSGGWRRFKQKARILDMQPEHPIEAPTIKARRRFVKSRDFDDYVVKVGRRWRNGLRLLALKVHLVAGEPLVDEPERQMVRACVCRAGADGPTG